jgi:hypothetical protein
MRKSDPIQQNDIAFAAQMITFKSEIGNYATTLNLTADQVKAQAADADYTDYVVKCQGIMIKSGQQWTAWRDLTRDGGTPPPTGVPTLPTLPPAVPAVGPGVEGRFRALVQLIKANPNYNPAMGQALGIEGAQQTPPDLTTIQPQIDAYINGNHVYVDWGWQGYSAYLDQCEIQVDRGDGKGYGFLTYATSPGYTDTQPLPAAPVKWTYRAIYRVSDAEVGLWSNPVSLIVGG